ncbi:hypothetical protein ACP3V3_01915 [Vibrio sp. PNB22_3_1]
MSSTETLLHRSQKWLKTNPNNNAINEAILSLKESLNVRPKESLTDCQSTIALLESEIKSRQQPTQQEDPQPLMLRSKQWLKTNPKNKDIIDSIRALKRTLSSRPREAHNDVRNAITLLNEELEQREINKIQKRIHEAKQAKEKALNQAADNAATDTPEDKEETKPKPNNHTQTPSETAPTPAESQDPNLHDTPDPSIKELHGTEKQDVFQKLKAQFGQ